MLLKNYLRKGKQSQSYRSVPQGSVLEPLPFLTNNFSIVKDFSQSLSDLNYDLETINQLVSQWKMSFHPDHNKQVTEVSISRKINQVR